MSLLPPDVRRAARQSAACREALLYLAQKVLHNVLTHPEEPRYRRLNMEGKAFTSTLAPHPACEQVLRRCGFCQEDGYLVLPEVDPNHLAAIQQAIEVSLGVDSIPRNSPDLKWVRPPRTGVPPFAVHGGHEGNGSPLFVARGSHGGGLHPGKSDGTQCWIGYAGQEVVLQEFEMLTCVSVPPNCCLQWREGLQSDAVAGGAEADGRPLLVARMSHEGGVHPGKAGRHLTKGSACGWGGQEVEFESFQTLVVAPQGGDGVPATIEGDMSRPEARPLYSLAELRSWQPGADPFNVCGVAPPRRPPRGGRQLLVCHDLLGGYGPGDRYPQGGDTENVYTFDWWHLCDIFVYFSHHRVTIPPAAWVNVAHRHGVPILGTFITEWDAGAAECVDLLSSLDRCLWHADKLVEVAVCYGFDGWLINVENPVPPLLMPNLVEMCRHLTQRMHQVNPAGRVIWYDSVTYPDGKLAWQDRLNALNAPFFDATDGLFTNYTWKEAAPGLSAAFAEGRRHDVFVGIDVFGRNTFGGGQWACPVALEVIRAADCSVALFAPSWTFQCEGHGNRQCFEQADARFWAAWQACDFTAATPTVQRLPFGTTFDKGCGPRRYLDGTLLSAHPWCDIAAQDNPPPPQLLAASDPTPVVCEVTAERPHTGGSSLCFTGAAAAGCFAVFRLLSAAVPLPPSLTVSLTLACEGQLAFRVAIVLQRGSENLVAFLHPTNDADDSVKPFSLMHLHPVDTTQKDAWTSLAYRLVPPGDGWQLLSVLGICGDAAAFLQAQARASPAALPPTAAAALRGSVFVGEIWLRPMPGSSPADVPVIDAVVASDLSRNILVTPNTISLTISWDCATAVSHCNVYLNGTFQGRAYCSRFRLCGIPVNTCLDVQVQPVLGDGVTRPVADLTHIHVEL